jgi:serine phosphatase RsbU (regulator of sigma subunit)
MQKIIKILAFIATVATVGPASAIPTIGSLEITEETPIVFAEQNNLLVIEDKSSTMTIQDVLNSNADDVDISRLPTIDAKSHYWILQKLKNSTSQNFQFRVDPSNWESIECFAISADGTITRLKPSGYFRVSYSLLADANPFSSGSAKVPSQFALHTLMHGQEILLISRVKSSPNGPMGRFSLTLYNHVKFLELKRYGLYIEGVLLGVLLALAIFGCSSAYNNKDKASLAYGIWIIVAFFQIVSMYAPDGPRLAEFFVNLEDVPFLHHYMYGAAFGYFFGYAQAVLYAVFAATFLNVKKHAPWLYKLTIFYVFAYILHYLFTNLVQHSVPQKVLWLVPGGLTFILLASFFGIAFARVRKGHVAARFFMFAIIPYLFFRSIFILGLAGVPSPFSLMEPVGIGLILQNSSTAQAIGLCCEATIMALAVISRTRWLQLQLAQNLESQKVYAENQNRILEATVEERTRELAEQHKELDKTHQLVVSSVNYASRLQRSQLPNRHRLDQRFRSISTIWQPRDTIGGDLWWVSSSQMKQQFSLAVVDCTGHGVPGAMLSLLVSSSLERIYSGDPSIEPSRALMALDHLVRVGLNQDSSDSESDDGCDAAIIKFDLAARQMGFSGAKINLFQLSADGSVHRHLAARASLGYQNPPDSEDEPIDIPISFQSGDVFVIVTDGFTDQVGGDRVQPSSYGTRRLERLLAATRNYDADDIRNRMWNDFIEWQGSQTRRDDVTAVVFVMM